MATSTSPARRRVHIAWRSRAREPGVEHRDVVAEAGAEARDELRRERDLRHEHDDARSLARGGDGAQVDLGLAGAGHAVEEERGRARLAKRARDCVDGGRLRVGERGRGVARDGLGEERIGGRSFSSIATSPSSWRRLTEERAPGQRSSSRAIGSVPTARKCVTIEAARGPSRRLRLSSGVDVTAVTHCTFRAPTPFAFPRTASAPRVPRATSFSTGGSASSVPLRWARGSTARGPSGTRGGPRARRPRPRRPTRSASLSAAAPPRAPSGRRRRGASPERAGHARSRYDASGEPARHRVREGARERDRERDVREEQGDRAQRRGPKAATSAIASAMRSPSAMMASARPRRGGRVLALVATHRRRRHHVHGGRRKRRGVHFDRSPRGGRCERRGRNALALRRLRRLRAHSPRGGSPRDVTGGRRRRMRRHGGRERRHRSQPLPRAPLLEDLRAEAIDQPVAELEGLATSFASLM